MFVSNSAVVNDVFVSDVFVSSDFFALVFVSTNMYGLFLLRFPLFHTLFCFKAWSFKNAGTFLKEFCCDWFLSPIKSFFKLLIGFLCVQFLFSEAIPRYKTLYQPPPPPHFLFFQ